MKAEIMNDLQNSTSSRSLLDLVVNARDSQTQTTITTVASVADVAELLSASPGGAPDSVTQAVIVGRLQAEHKSGRLPFHVIGTKQVVRPISLSMILPSRSRGASGGAMLAKWRASRTERDREGLQSSNFDDYCENGQSHDQKAVKPPASAKTETEPIYGILANELQNLKTRLAADGQWSTWADTWCNLQTNLESKEILSKAEIGQRLGTIFKNDKAMTWATFWDSASKSLESNGGKVSHGKYNLSSVVDQITLLGYTTKKDQAASQTRRFVGGKLQQSAR